MGGDNPSKSRWYIVEEEVVTESEKKGEVPFPQRVVLVVLEPRWSVFSGFLKQTEEPVKFAFRGTDLEPKVEPYKQALPQPMELPAPFFVRHLKKLQAPKAIVSQMEALIPDNPTHPADFPHNSFSTELYCGQEIERVDFASHRYPKAGDTQKGRIRSRAVIVSSSYDITFATGFNRDKRWVYSVELRDRSHSDTYDKLLRALRMIDIISMLSTASDRDSRRDIDYTILS